MLSLKEDEDDNDTNYSGRYVNHLNYRSQVNTSVDKLLELFFADEKIGNKCPTCNSNVIIR